MTDTQVRAMLNGFVEKDVSGLTANQFAGYVSTLDVDRDGEVILPKAFQASIEQYMRNPVIFAAHLRVGSGGEPTVIGKAVTLTVDDYGLRFVGEFADTDLALQWKKLIQGGFVTGISHRFMPSAWEDKRNADGTVTRVYTEVELLEISVEPLHSNRGALIDAVGKHRDDPDVDSDLARTLVKAIDAVAASDGGGAAEWPTPVALKVADRVNQVAEAVAEVKTLIDAVRGGMVTADALEAAIEQLKNELLDPDHAYARALDNQRADGAGDSGADRSTEQALTEIAEVLRRRLGHG